MSEHIAANQAHFNKIAAEYDSRFGETIVQLQKEVQNNIDFIGFRKGGRLLDYACGTGLLSRALEAEVSQSVGVDLSESMVEAYNAKARKENIPEETKHAYLGNLTLPTDPNPEAFTDAERFSNFDLAGVGMGFHHFNDCDLAARRLGERLRKGGVLFILDFIAHAPDKSSSHAGVTHHGFSEERTRAVFEGAGVGGNFAFKEIGDGVVFKNARGEGQDLTRRVFLARGEKV